jgi:hypothetical protein
MLNKDVCRKCWGRGSAEWWALRGRYPPPQGAIYCDYSGTPGPTWLGFMETKPPPKDCPHKLEHAVSEGMTNDGR